VVWENSIYILELTSNVNYLCGSKYCICLHGLKPLTPHSLYWEYKYSETCLRKTWLRKFPA
jgi:hypothetical protein